MEQIVGSAPVEVKKKGVFKVGVITVGAFIGGPFVGGWMLGENFKELGKPDLAKKYKIGGLIVFIALLVLVFLIDTDMKNSLSFLAPVLVLGFFNRYQKKEVESYITNGGIKRTKWPKVCIIFTIALYVLAISLFLLGSWAEKQISVQDDYIKNGQEGVNFIQAGKYKEAIVLFDKNILADSKDAESYVFRGTAKLQSDDIKGAIEDFTLALANKNNDLNDRAAYYYRGQAYISEQKFTEALSDFKNAIKSPVGDSNIPEEELYTATFRMNAVLENKEEMLSDINEVIKINPDYESARLIRAQLEIESGDVKSACEDVKNGKNTSSIPEIKAGLEKFTELLIAECNKL